MNSSQGEPEKKPAAPGGRGGPIVGDDPPPGFPGAGGRRSDSDKALDYDTGGEKMPLSFGKNPAAAGGRGGPTIGDDPPPGFPGAGGGGSNSDKARDYYYHSGEKRPLSFGKNPAASGGRGGPTIGDLTDPPAGFPGAGGSGSNTVEAQDYYYNSGEKSGMLVQDQNEGIHGYLIFEQATELGAQQVPPHHFVRSFRGLDRLISWDAQKAPPLQSNFINVFLWNNGFTVDDGPVRGYLDPWNSDFLESIMKCQFPQELQPTDPTISVHLNIIKQHRDHKGVGKTLGGGASTDHGPAEDLVIQVPTAASSSIALQPFHSTHLRRITEADETDFCNLLEQGEWKRAESSLLNFLQSDLKEHPVPFLQIRRLELIRLIETRRCTAAATHFELYIKGPLNLVLQKPLLYACQYYIKREIDKCKIWVDTQRRRSHDYGNSRIVTNFIFDYLRLHVPQNIGYEIPKNLKGVYWHFAIEVPKVKPSRHRSYRCMACSAKYIHDKSISEMRNHLKSCPMMTSRYLKCLFDALVKKEPKGNQQEDHQKITSAEYHQLLLSDIESVNAAVQNISKIIPESADTGSLINSLKLLKEHADGLYASSCGAEELCRSVLRSQATPGSSQSLLTGSSWPAETSLSDHHAFLDDEGPELTLGLPGQQQDPQLP